MRGLTEKERAWLIGDEMDTELAHILEARGLVVEAPCEECGSLPNQLCHEDCSCPPIPMDLTDVGELALRLDAAARGMGVGVL